MRLTAELIANSLSYLNPVKERELDLRGHKIPAIENLGVAKDNDALDLTDNDIQQLGNFPLSPRLKTLLLARNRISNIQPNIGATIPNLENLILNSNSLAELADLDPIQSLRRLTNLTLMDNPVTRKEHYRDWVVWRCPSVRFLDYQKVKEADRKRAEQLFGTPDDPTPLAAQIMGVKSRTFDLGGPPGAAKEKEFRTKLTDAEKKAIEAKIKAAKSLDEIARLEKELRDGTIIMDMMEE